VLTGALMYRDKVRVELSGFYGTEPGEQRWTIEQGPINSWAARFSVFPTKNWMAQVSVGRITRPERQEAGDVVRSTASVHYTRPMQGSDWSTSLIWGRNHKIADRRNLNSYLLESVLPYRRRNFFTGRIELVDKDELFNDQPDLEARLDRTVGSTFRVQAYTLGYTRDIGTFHNMQTGLGANFTVYATPSAIHPYYGDHPAGFNVYARLRLNPSAK